MPSPREIAAILVLALGAVSALGQGPDFSAQDAARRAAEGHFQQQQRVAQEQARLAQAEAAQELWLSRLCYLATVVVFAGCLWTPWYAAGAVLRRFENGRLAFGLFVTMFACYALPLLLAWPDVASDYAPVRAAEVDYRGVMKYGQLAPDLFQTINAEAAARRRVEEVRNASRLQLARQELPHVFDAVPHAYRHQRGLVYSVLATELAIACIAVGLVSRLKPVDRPRRAVSTQPKKVCEACGQLNGLVANKCIQCNGVAFSPPPHPTTDSAGNPSEA